MSSPNKVRIQDATTSLEIMTTDLVSADVPYVVSVRVGETFSARCHGVFFVVDSELRLEFMRFEDFQNQAIKIGMTVGSAEGAFAICRRRTGGITFDYEAYDLSVGDKCCLKGRIEINGDNAAEALRALRKVVFSKVAAD